MTTMGESNSSKGLQESRSRAFRGVATLAAAVGFVAVSAFAIGRLSIRRLKIRNASIRSLDLQDLSVKRLRVGVLIVSDSLRLPGTDGDGKK
jgi:hypothetical protein